MNTTLLGLLDDAIAPGTLTALSSRTLATDDRGGSGNDDRSGNGRDDNPNRNALRINRTGGAGNDNLIGGVNSDRLVGLGGNDTLSGGGDGDILLGGAGHDRLIGGDDGDTLNGGLGNDILIGGDDRDVLIGGGGRDRFVVGQANPADDDFDGVRDFQNGIDRIVVQGIGSFGQLNVTQRGANTLISIGSNEVVQLIGIRANTITAADFVF